MLASSGLVEQRFEALEERKQAKSEAIAEAAEQISNSNEAENSLYALTADASVTRQVISNAEIQVEEDSESSAWWKIQQ